MKQQLLLLVFAVFSISAFAQQPKSVHISELKPVEGKNTNEAHYVAPPRVPANASYRGTVIPLGSSYNVYSILLDRQNQVYYDKDINSVSFVHRQNAGAAGGSGIISFDVSTDGGLTWDVTNKPITPSAGTGVLNGNRYPNGTIWNPSGNTDPANARFVAFGAALTSAGSGIWGMMYQSSSKFDGTDVKEHYYATPDTNSLIPGGLTVLPNGDMYAFDTWDNNFQAALYKITYNSTTSDFDVTPTYWSYDLTGASATDSSFWFQTDPNIAFGPDGMTGYAVMSAVTPDHGNFTARPVIWKTTDAGANWTQLSTIDWQAFPELLDWTFHVESANDTTNGRFPYFRDYDLTVDKDGALHIFANMSSRSDSLDPNFIWVDNINTNSLWHIETTDGSSYSMELIDPWLNTWGDIQGDGERWWGPRPQMSRSEDGSKLFFCWTMTDTLFTLGTVNIAPDLYVLGRNLDNGYDSIKILTKGTSAEFLASWATVAPIVIEDQNGIDYEIPVVYGVPTASDLDQIDYFYIQGVGYTDSCLMPITISTNELEVQEANIKVYPNPTSGFLNVDLTTLTEDVNIDVFNMVGQNVRSIANARDITRVDLSDMTTGVYFIRISNDAAVISKKIILTK